jgi:nucleoside-diphosphate-sugar epimerase
MIADAVGYHPVILPNAAKAGSSSFRVADATGLVVLHQTTGWQASVPLAEGIRQALDYFKAQGRL